MEEKEGSRRVRGGDNRSRDQSDKIAGEQQWEHRKLLEAGKSKVHILPWILQKEHGPADT